MKLQPIFQIPVCCVATRGRSAWDTFTQYRVLNSRVVTGIGVLDLHLQSQQISCSCSDLASKHHKAVHKPPPVTFFFPGKGNFK